MKRILSILLVLVMVLSCMPVTALASETEAPVITEPVVTEPPVTEPAPTEPAPTEPELEPTAPDPTEAEPVAQSALSPDESGAYHITTFSELKELCNQGLSSLIVYYEGTAPLVIEENITLPGQIGTEFRTTGTVTIPSGVTVAGLHFFFGGSLNVAGTLTANYLAVDALNVTGSLSLNNRVILASGSTITGESNINFATDYADIYYSYFCPSLDAVKQVIALANNDTNPHHLYGALLQADITFSESLTIPANLTLSTTDSTITSTVFSDYDITIPAGVTLTVNGVLSVTKNTTINGTLVNNGEISVNGANGTQVFASNDSYQGSGLLVFYGSSSNPLDVITGCDFPGYSITQAGTSVWNITPRVLAPDENGAYHITSFDELKELSQKTYSQWTAVQYEGTEDLVISESITLPENLSLYAYGAGVSIPADVTVTAEDGVYFTAKTIQIAGTMNAYAMFAMYALDLTGTLTIRSSLVVETATTAISGESKIQYADGAYMMKNSYIGSLAELVDACENTSQDSNVNHRYTLIYQSPNAISQNLIIPTNTTLAVGSFALSVDAGVTLTVDGTLETHRAVTINGTVVNNGTISIYTPTVTFAGGSALVGNGVIKVWDIMPSQALSGINLTYFKQEQFYDEVSSLSGWILTKTDTPQPDQYGNIFFSTIDELKLIAAGSYSTPVYAVYSLSDTPLVISEDISLSANINLSLQGSTATIPAGVTVTVNEGASLYASNLTVNGTVKCGGTFSIMPGGSLSGEENVQFTTDSARLYRNSMLDSTMEALTDALSSAAADAHPNHAYALMLTSDLTIDQSITVPANTDLQLSAGSLSAGCELIVNGSLGFAGAFTVNGSLVNNNKAVVYPYASLTLSDTGSYSGDGIIQVNTTDSSLVPEDVLVGIDLTGYSSSSEYDSVIYMTVWTLTKDTPPALEPDERGDYHITTFEELKQLAQGTYDSSTHAYVYYEGASPLTIEEDITLPNYWSLISNDACSMTIPAGVTMTLPGGSLDVDILNVEGTLDVSQLYVNTELNVTGDLQLRLYLNVSTSTKILGESNIQYATDNMLMYIEGRVTSEDEFLAALQQASMDTNPRHRYQIGTYYYGEIEVTFTQNITIPENMYFHFDMNNVTSLVISPGCTLTVDGEMYIGGSTVLSGNLVNNGTIDLGTFTFTEDASYSGTGVMVLSKAPEQALLGLDLTNYTIEKDGYNYLVYAPSKVSDPLEEIQAAIASGASDYTLTQPLTITQDTVLELGDMVLYVNGTTLTVNNSVSLTVNANNGGITLNNSTLTVDGSLVSHGSIFLNDGSMANVTASGVLINSGSVHVGFWKNTATTAPAGILNVEGCLENNGYLNICAEGTESGGQVSVSGTLNVNRDDDAGIHGFAQVDGQLSLTGNAVLTVDAQPFNGGIAVNPTGTLNIGTGCDISGIVTGSITVEPGAAVDGIDETFLQFVSGDYTYVPIAQGACYVTGYHGTESSITIPSKIDDRYNFTFGYQDDRFGPFCPDTVTSITFEGDAPIFLGNAFTGLELSVNYPADNTTWTEVVKQNYGGKITWVPNHPILEGKTETWVTGSTTAAPPAVRIDYPVEKFLDVYMNGKLVDPVHYVVTEGSTIVTFKQSFLDTLEPGTYNVTVNFTDGSAANSDLIVNTPCTEHTWDDGVVTKEPTATEPGVKTYTCTGCGDTKTEEIPATGEEEVNYGDANGDGKINSRDVLTILQFRAGKDVTINETAADVNQDGKINSRDILAILQLRAGK